MIRDGIFTGRIIIDILHDLQFPDRRNDPFERLVKNRVARRIDHHAEQREYGNDIDNITVPRKAFRKHHNTENQQQSKASYIRIMQVHLQNRRQNPSEQQHHCRCKQKDKQ
ncbi:hypothetical protein D3C73_1384460 [compost metagenome]